MKVFITPEAKQRLDLYTEIATGEISGLGRARVHAGNIFIEDVYLLKQSCTSADTELDPEDVAAFLGEVIASEIPPEEIKVWWHSHAGMSCFWSGTDEKTAQCFANGWMLSLVVNKKKEYKCRLDVYDPVHLTADSLELVIAYPEAAAELRRAVEAEVKEKVTNKAWSGGVTTGQAGGHSWHQGGYNGYGGMTYINGKPVGTGSVMRDSADEMPRTYAGHHKIWDQRAGTKVWYIRDMTPAEIAEEEEEDAMWRQQYGY
jgi:hypothetical protein